MRKSLGSINIQYFILVEEYFRIRLEYIALNFTQSSQKCRQRAAKTIGDQSSHLQSNDQHLLQNWWHTWTCQTSTPWNKKLCKIMHKLQNWWRTWSNSSQTSTPWNKKLCKIMKNCKIDGTHGLYTPASFNSKLCKNCKSDETCGLATRSFSVKDSNLDFKIMHQRHLWNEKIRGIYGNRWIYVLILFSRQSAP